MKKELLRKLAHSHRREIEGSSLPFPLHSVPENTPRLNLLKLCQIFLRVSLR